MIITHTMELQEQINILNIRVSELEHKLAELTKKSVRKHAFEKSEWYDIERFKAHFLEKGWNGVEIGYWYGQALSYSQGNGGRYTDWSIVVQRWRNNEIKQRESQRESKFDKINRNV